MPRHTSLNLNKAHVRATRVHDKMPKRNVAAREKIKTIVSIRSHRKYPALWSCPEKKYV
jgi:hypothetical protein